MRKFLLFMTMMLIGIAVKAQVQEAVNVHLLNGAVNSTRFEDFHKFIVAGDNLVLLEVSGESTTIAIDDIQKIMFGPYHATNAVENVQLADVTIYQLNGNCVVSCDESIRSVMMFDLSGRILHHQTTENGLLEYSVPVGDFVSGVYLVTVETERGATTKKVVIK